MLILRSIIGWFFALRKSQPESYFLHLKITKKEKDNSFKIFERKFSQDNVGSWQGFNLYRFFFLFSREKIKLD